MDQKDFETKVKENWAKDESSLPNAEYIMFLSKYHAENKGVKIFTQVKFIFYLITIGFGFLLVLMFGKRRISLDIAYKDEIDTYWLFKYYNEESGWCKFDVDNEVPLLMYDKGDLFGHIILITNKNIYYFLDEDKGITNTNKSTGRINLTSIRGSIEFKKAMLSGYTNILINGNRLGCVEFDGDSRSPGSLKTIFEQTALRNNELITYKDESPNDEEVAPSLESKLKEAQGLYDKGLINAEELKSKREQILSS
ncbi:hypothetical protein HOF92_11340 [bacterium]|jgi:hypothetical protein|nr:hypothetical protein [bacterium]